MRSGRIATRTHMVLVARANAPVRWQPARVFGGALFRRSSGADTPPFIINQLKLSVYHETGEVAVRSGILRNILVECNVFGHLGARRKVGLFMLSSCSSLAMLQSSSSSCACSCSATCTPINSGGSHHSMVSGIKRKHPAQQAQHPCPHPGPGDLVQVMQTVTQTRVAGAEGCFVNNIRPPTRQTAEMPLTKINSWRVGIEMGGPPL
jgi:hypothetical protein